jgi:hypothetical protein
MMVKSKREPKYKREPESKTVNAQLRALRGKKWSELGVDERSLLFPGKGQHDARGDRKYSRSEIDSALGTNGVIDDRKADDARRGILR